MKKRMLILTLCLMTSGALATTGCSNIFGFGGSSDSSSSFSSSIIEDSSSYKRELKVWWPSGASTGAILDDAIERFNNSYPDITFKVVKKAGMDVYQSYLLALNDDNSRPDVAIVDHVYVQNLAFENQIANLTALSNSDKVEDSFPSSLYKANFFNGSNYAMPLSANTVTLMCNMDILKEAGIESMPTTYSELLDDCEQIKTKTSYTPFAQPINNSFCAMEFASYVAREGGSMISDDYKTIKLDSEEVGKAVNDWVSLSKYASQAEFEEGKFYGGSIAFIEMGSWNLSKVTEGDTSFDLGLTQISTIKDTLPNYSGLGLYSLTIAEKSPKKLAAYQFAKFLSTDKEFQIAFNKDKSLLPVTNEALNDDYYAQDKFLGIYSKQLQNVAPRPGTPVWPTMEQQIVNMLYNSVKATSQDGIDSAIATAQKKVQEATNTKFGL